MSTIMAVIGEFDMNGDDRCISGNWEIFREPYDVNFVGAVFSGT